MSQRLSLLLDSQGSLLRILLHDLELATGQQGLDAELVGRIATATNLKLRQLGFATGVVTQDELNQALLFKLDQAESTIRQKMLARQQDITGLIQPLLSKIKVWSLSQIAIDRLRAEFGEQLNSEMPSEALKKIAQMQLGYFEQRPLCIVNGSDCLAKLDAVVVFDHPVSTGDSSLQQLTKLVDQLEQRIMHSNVLALILAAKQRTGLLQTWLANVLTDEWQLAGNLVPRKTIYDLLADPTTLIGSKLKSTYPDIARSLIRPELYNWLAEEVLSEKWWCETAELAMVDERGQVISLNWFDAACNGQNHLGEAVWLALMTRYLNNNGLSQQIINQLAKKLYF